MPPFSPKSPLPGLHNPKAQKAIGHRVGDDAGSQAAGLISDEIIKGAADYRRDPVRPRMGKPKGEGDDGEGEPGESSDRERREPFVDQIAQKKSAPEDFFNQRDNDNQPEESEDDRS